MTIKEIRAMKTEEELRGARESIRTAMTAADADIDSLSAMVDAIEVREAELKKAYEARQALAARIGAGTAGVTLSTMPMETAETVGGADSEEYRQAFLLHLMHRDDEMTKEQRTAYVHTTNNTSAVMPRTMVDKIWSLIEEEHPIVGDVTVYRTGTIIEVIKHTAIAAGDAANVAENVANDDEQNTFVKVTLSGKDFSKHIDITYALGEMAVDSFESYLINEIGSRIGAIMAEDVVDNAIVANIDSGNIVVSGTAKTLTYAEAAAAFGLLKNARGVKVYGTRKTIYAYLVGMSDTNKRPIFQPDAQQGALGMFLGGQIKVEDAVDDNVLLIGDPANVVYNMVQDIMIETDKDIKKHVKTYAGYARGEGVLINPQAFVKLTIKQS